jgi:hypothetical protein
VADLGPNKKRIAQLFRMLGSSGGERRNAFAALERIMQSEGVSWTDIGDTIEHAGEYDEGKYNEDDLQQFGQVQRAEGVEAGIKIGEARKSNGSSNGHLTLPSPVEMADFCAARRGRLKDDNQRKFIDDMVVATRHQMFLRYRLTPGRLGYLASIYIQNGGTT